MALSNAAATVIAALIVALIGAAGSLLAVWMQRRKPKKRLRDVWERKAQELDDRLSTQYEGRLADKDRQIAGLEQRNTHLEALLENRQRDARSRAHDG